MQISSSSNFSALSGAQVALRLIGGTTPAQKGLSPQKAESGSATGDVSQLLSYLKTAKAAAATETAPSYDPADSLPDGWSMGDLVSIDSLTPELRDFAASFGATHVRLYGADAVDDETFTRKVGAFLDGADPAVDSYAHDAAYLAAKSKGTVSIRRLSDVLAEVGDTRGRLSQSIALFRGPNGAEYFGSGSGGTPSADLQAWQAAQEAAGQVVVIGGTMGQEFVANWAAL